MLLASKHCISSVLTQRCQPERAGDRAAVRKRVLGGTGRERKRRLRPALLGLFERKEIVHPFPSKHRSARRASTHLLTMVCVGSVSLEFVLAKVTVTTKTTRSTKNAARFEALHIRLSHLSRNFKTNSQGLTSKNLTNLSDAYRCRQQIVPRCCKNIIML